MINIFINKCVDYYLSLFYKNDHYVCIQAEHYVDLTVVTMKLYILVEP